MDENTPRWDAPVPPKPPKSPVPPPNPPPGGAGHLPGLGLWFLGAFFVLVVIIIWVWALR